MSRRHRISLFIVLYKCRHVARKFLGQCSTPQERGTKKFLSIQLGIIYVKFRNGRIPMISLLSSFNGDYKQSYLTLHTINSFRTCNKRELLFISKKKQKSRLLELSRMCAE